jgi:site-specific DNA-methyltransferase (adenine-specific)
MLELPQNILHTQIGEATLINADCFDVFPFINDHSIDCIIADLPFFGVVKDDWDNQWKSENEYLEWCKEVIIQYKRVLKYNGNIFLFTGRQYNRKISCMLDDYFIEKRIIIWARKRNFNSTRGTALASGYEPLCYYSNSNNAVFNNIKIPVDSKRKEYTEGFLKDGISLSDVWSDIPALPHNSKEKVSHPTQKPLKLIERIVKIGTNQNDLILDNVSGSGTTGLASINNGRKFIGIEKEKEYYDISVQRLLKESIDSHSL